MPLNSTPLFNTNHTSHVRCTATVVCEGEVLFSSSLQIVSMVQGSAAATFTSHFSLAVTTEGSFRGFSGNTEGVKHLSCEHLYQ